MRASHSPASKEVQIPLTAESDTTALGRELSFFVRPGDWLLLFGDLGAGKSTLARAFIHALAPEAGAFDVPSPTFTLVQAYDFTRVPVAHADLYRIGDPEEVFELGLEDLAQDHVLLVEWPGRLPAPPQDRLEILLEHAGQGRLARLRGFGSWAARLQRMEQARRFLAASHEGPFERRFLMGDASSRRYERITAPGRPAAILMDMPGRPDGPPLRGGRSYDEIARLARSARAVWAVNTVLAERGFSAPRIFAQDLEHGLMLLEDLGDAVFGRLYARGEMAEPLAAAVDVLAAIAAQDWPARVRTPGGEHHVAAYDDEAFLAEAELLLDWFLPHVEGARADDDMRSEYRRIWRALLPLARVGAPVWVLRDYHSPNLIWLPRREGLARVGLIDTQDVVLGPAAYDLASLLQDARFTIPPQVEEQMLERYLALRAAAGPGFDAAAFRVAHAVMGAQRAAKVLGIFVRLKERDAKPAYMAHIPRLRRYLARNLAHPALAPLAGWLRRHAPSALPGEE